MKGDGEARAGDLVARYAKLIRSAAARVLGRRDADLGDDVIQQVSEALWKQIQGEQNIDHPASYIYRCAVRETVRLLRRELAQGHVPLDAAAEQPSRETSPEDAARARELATMTERVLASMAGERAAAVRAHLAGFAVEDVMRMHGWPYHKARNLISRGLADLRAGLRDQGIS